MHRSTRLRPLRTPLCLIVAVLAAGTGLTPAAAQQGPPPAPVERAEAVAPADAPQAPAAEAATPAAEAEATPPTAAIFVRNRAGEGLAEKRGLFEDFLVDEFTSRGVRLLAPADVLEAVSNMSGSVVDEPAADSLDTLLSDDTSALRLAQNLDVDYLVIGSLGSLTSSARTLNRPDIDVNRTIHRARLIAGYKVLDRVKGAALVSSQATAEKSIQESAGASGFNFEEVVDDLLLSVADDIGTAFEAALPRVPKPEELPGMVTVQLLCTSQDLMVPEVIKDEDGEYILTNNRFQAQPMSVTVEVDGVVVGTAPGEIQVFPGLHKLRLTRELFEPWERTVNFKDDPTQTQTLQVALALTEEGRLRWEEVTGLYDELKNSQRTNAAQGEVLESLGQMLRQSGIRIDSDEVPEVLLVD